VEDLIRSLHKPGQPAQQGGISSYIVVTHQHSTIMRAVDRSLSRPLSIQRRTHTQTHTHTHTHVRAHLHTYMHTLK
jgi:hypothetical protein